MRSEYKQSWNQSLGGVFERGAGSEYSWLTAQIRDLKMLSVESW